MSSQIEEMRLKGKFRPLHDAYFVGGEIVERDSDVEFQCQDGVLKAHKIILASASTFFIQLFENHKCGKMTTVCVPDIDTETMQLILKLAYREKVSMSMKRIRDVRDYLNLFGMEWKNFIIECIVESHGDINLGGPDENFPERNPNEIKRCPGPSDNLIQSSIAPNKRPRFENPSKEKQRPIRKTSPPSKKDNQNQPQIVKDLTTDNPSDKEKQQPKPPLSPSKKVPQQKQPQIVQYLTSDDPALKNWINSLGKSGAQQDRITTADQQPTSSNRSVQQQNEQTTPKYKQISRSSAAKPATNIRSTNKSPIQKEKLSLVRTARDQYRKPVSVNYANLAKYRSHRTQPNQGNAGRPPKPSTLQKQVSAIVNNVSSSTISPSTPTPKSSTDGAGKLLFKNKDIPVGAGEVEDCEEKEVAILKGIYLAWTYFCDKCNQESESVQKAHDHYLQCCEDEIPEFVNSLHRYSYNYYGSIKCCRCFKGYSLNSSFSRHCGRSHSEFKEKFSVGNDDKIICGHCKGKFSDPQQFDDHLDANENCPRGENSSINSELEVGENPFEASRRQRLAKSKCNNSRPHRAKTTATVARAGPSYSLRVLTRPKLNSDNQATYSAGENPSDVRRRQRLAKSKRNNFQPHRAKMTATVTRTGPSPRVVTRATYSAVENPSEVRRRQRLAKSKWNNSYSRPHRAKTTVARTGPGPRVKRPKLNPENEATYSVGQCPICKERDVAKIVEHIKTEHGKFDFNIVQVSNMAMKCKTCNTSFEICDLLTHYCQVSQRQKEPQQQDKPTVTKTQTKVVPQGGDQEDFILVNGIGNSPIDVMECSDFLNVNTIREAFNCQVCGKKGEKMGFGAKCLRTHNIHRCPLCFNTYRNKEDYSMHIKVCHGSGTGAGLYCPCCPKTQVFANIGSVASHMHSTHWAESIRIMSIIDRQKEIISNSQHSGKIIDNNPTMTRPAKNADKNESNLDVTLENIFDETRGITDDKDVKATVPEVVNDNDKSEDKTQTIETIENEDKEINSEENGVEGSQDSDLIILIDETETQEDLVLDPVASAK